MKQPLLILISAERFDFSVFSDIMQIKMFIATSFLNLVCQKCCNKQKSRLIRCKSSLSWLATRFVSYIATLFLDYICPKHCNSIITLGGYNKFGYSNV